MSCEAFTNSPLESDLDALDTRPLVVLPFANHISSLNYDSKHDHLAVGLQSGNICILERTTGENIEMNEFFSLFIVFLGVNDLPTIQHISNAPIVDVHSLQGASSQNSDENLSKTNGFLFLSADGQIYRAKFQTTSSENVFDIDRNVTHCFPQ